MLCVTLSRAKIYAAMSLGICVLCWDVSQATASIWSTEISLADLAQQFPEQSDSIGMNESSEGPAQHQPCFDELPFDQQSSTDKSDLGISFSSPIAPVLERYSFSVIVPSEKVCAFIMAHIPDSSILGLLRPPQHI